MPSGNRRHSFAPRTRRVTPAALLLLAACGSSGDGSAASGPTGTTGAASQIVLTVALPRLDTTLDGRYEAWVVDAGGAHHSLGRFAVGGTLTFPSPVASSSPAAVEITVERPADIDGAPSAQLLLRGVVQRGHADLGYAGAVTQNDLPLRAAPG